MNIENNHWLPNIGDPNITGWVTVAAYIVIALICLKAAFSKSTDKSVKIFWLLLCTFLIILGINKQFDLQTVFTLFSKNIAKKQDWYESRYIVQIAFIILIGSVGSKTVTYLLKNFQDTCSSVKIALSVSAILFCFILIKASSFHYLDLLINIKLIGMKINTLFELGALAIIGISSLKFNLKYSS